MFNYSKKSEERLATCHPELQRLFRSVLKEADHIIICGHRGEAEQEAAWKNGNSQLRWPQSKHNSLPSMAVDAAPCKVENGKTIIDWNDIEGFKKFGNIVKRHAEDLGIDISWGGEWVRFRDYPHYQLEE